MEEVKNALRQGWAYSELSINMILNEKGKKRKYFFPVLLKTLEISCIMTV